MSEQWRSEGNAAANGNPPAPLPRPPLQYELQLAPRASDDQLLAELPAHIGYVLQAAKTSADQFVANATARASLIEQQALDEARDHVARGRTRAQEIVEAAQRSAQKLVADAHAERDSILAELATRQATL